MKSKLAKYKEHGLSSQVYHLQDIRLWTTNFLFSPSFLNQRYEYALQRIIKMTIYVGPFTVSVTKVGILVIINSFYFKYYTILFIMTTKKVQSIKV